jgi:hypothetical protein
MSYTPCWYFGSPRVVVSRCKTKYSYAVTAEVEYSSRWIPFLHFIARETTYPTVGTRHRAMTIQSDWSAPLKYPFRVLRGPADNTSRVAALQIVRLIRSEV